MRSDLDWGAVRPERASDIWVSAVEGEADVSDEIANVARAALPQCLKESWRNLIDAEAPALAMAQVEVNTIVVKEFALARSVLVPARAVSTPAYEDDFPIRLGEILHAFPEGDAVEVQARVGEHLERLPD